MTLNTLKSKILVVDDDASVRQSLTMLLAAEGYAVNSAVNGFDALLQLKSSLPDVITSDLNMPQMSTARSAGEFKRTAVTTNLVPLESVS
jgi:CheY-like chemotaxis protein